MSSAMRTNDWLAVTVGKDGSHHVFSRRAIPPGQIVFELPQVFTSVRDRHSIEVGPDRHQSFTGDIDDYINHSCDPNLELVVVDEDLGEYVFRAVRAIAPGEEVGWDYETFETELSNPFECRCGASSCRRLITGRAQ